MRVTMDRFQAAVEEAIASIPEPFQPYLDNTQFVIEKCSREGLLGLYEGGTAMDVDDGLPERITVYRDAHEEACDTWAELVDEVRRTILHEVGHHFGMEEDELPY